MVALRGETRVVGLLAVERDEPFSLRERRLLETVGAHAGSALESGQTARALAAVTELKERLAHEARHDPLTGLANRSLFSLRVEAALARDDNAPAVCSSTSTTSRTSTTRSGTPPATPCW